MSSNTEKLEYYAMATEKGHRFSTKGEAINNARLFVKQCQDALKVAA